MQYEYKVAYRHDDDSVEGFLGVGSTKAKAKADAIAQIERKLQIVADWYQRTTSAVEKCRLITSPSTLSPEDLIGVQTDWRSGVRY